MRRLIYFLLFVCSTATLLRAQEPQEPHNFQTTKALDIFNALYRNLDLYYVDTLNAEQQVEEAIDYMLDRLDPYTEFAPTNCDSSPRGSTPALARPFAITSAVTAVPSRRLI